SPLGACPACAGTGTIIELDLTQIVPDPSRSIRSGAIACWQVPAYQKHLDELIAAAPALDLIVDVPFRNLTPAQVGVFLEGPPDGRFPGLQKFFRSLEGRANRPERRLFMTPFRREIRCSACQGSRLLPEALAVRIEGLNIADLSAMSIKDL